MFIGIQFYFGDKTSSKQLIIIHLIIFQCLSHIVKVACPLCLLGEISYLLNDGLWAEEKEKLWEIIQFKKNSGVSPRAEAERCSLG